MLKPLKIFFVLFLMVLYSPFYSYADEIGKGHCPFGICMGYDPKSLYLDNKIVSSLLSDDFDPIIFYQLPKTPEFLNQFYDNTEVAIGSQKTKKDELDNVEFLANMNPGTGICSVIISMTLGDETL